MGTVAVYSTRFPCSTVRAFLRYMLVLRFFYVCESYSSFKEHKYNLGGVFASKKRSSSREKKEVKIECSQFVSKLNEIARSGFVFCVLSFSKSA